MSRSDVVAWAPGRVNLIGDHTDYNEGLALPMAIDLGAEVAYQESDSDRMLLISDMNATRASVPIALGLETGVIARLEPSWCRMSAAVIAACRPRTGGTIRIASTVPLGAGLSSSAAVCVALALALGAGPDPRGLARLCQRVESAAGSEVGLMDPLVSAAAQAGSAMLIDFSTLDFHMVPVPDRIEVVVVHSGRQRRLTNTAYAVRRAECAAAADALGVPLGQATESDLRRLDDRVLRARARHVVGECARTRSFTQALESGDFGVAGALMVESHRSMSTDFEASTRAVDQLVDLLAATPGVYGARMTGGGFGGCVVALAELGALDPSLWQEDVWRVKCSGGASVRPVS